MTPTISGREGAARLSARWSNVKLLYRSGYSKNSIIQHGVLDTETSFLPKPFTPAALKSEVHEVLDNSARIG